VEGERVAELFDYVDELSAPFDPCVEVADGRGRVYLA